MKKPPEHQEPVDPVPVEPRSILSFHDSVKEWLLAGEDLLIQGHSLVDMRPEITEAPGGTGRLELCVQVDLPNKTWVRFGLSILPDSPVADCWQTGGHGYRGVAQPTFKRVEHWVSSADGTTLAKIGNGPGQCLNGQGSTTQHFEYDFSSRTATPTHARLDSSDYIPRSANQTGGHWSYMQYRHDLSTRTLVQWREQLYPIACYGGRFTSSSENGSPVDVTQQHYPNMVLQNGSHVHRDKRNDFYIAYTDPRNPWKDKPDRDTPDPAHYSVYDSICELLQLYPWDLGLRWEVEFAAHRALFQLPGTDQGTYQWDPESARARGRILKFGVKCYDALMACGNVALAESVLSRIGERLANQINETRGRLKAGLPVVPGFESRDEPRRPDKHSPAEVGIWWMGVHITILGIRGLIGRAWTESLAALESGTLAELLWLQDYLAHYCFDSIFLDDNGEPQVPYYVTTGWDHPRQASGGYHFVWQAAVSHQPAAHEISKWHAIERSAPRIPKRFKVAD